MQLGLAGAQISVRVGVGLSEVLLRDAQRRDGHTQPRERGVQARGGAVQFTHRALKEQVARYGPKVLGHRLVS